MSTSDEVLKEIYYNPETGLVGRDKLYQAAKRVKPDISLREVGNFLKRQEPQQQFAKQKVVSRSTFPIHALTSEPFMRVQIDLLDCSNEFTTAKNRSYHFLFLLIDCNSRFVYSVPLKQKSQTECLAAFKKIVAQIEATHHTILQADMDSESAFKSRGFTAFCKSKNIRQHFVPIGDTNSLGFVNRFCLTFRMMYNRLKATKNRFDFVQASYVIVKNYNNQYHSIIKMTPAEAVQLKNNDAHFERIRARIFQARETTIGKLNVTIKPGDKVRLRIERSKFEKRSGAVFTKSVHTVVKQLPGGFWEVNGRQKLYRATDLLQTGTVDPVVQPADLTDYEPQIAQNRKTRTANRRVRKEGISEQDIVQPNVRRKRVRPDRGAVIEQGDYFPDFNE